VPDIIIGRSFERAAAGFEAHSFRQVIQAVFSLTHIYFKTEKYPDCTYSARYYNRPQQSYIDHQAAPRVPRRIRGMCKFIIAGNLMDAQQHKKALEYLVCALEHAERLDDIHISCKYQAPAPRNSSKRKSA
jgi:hypothetical protein